MFVLLMCGILFTVALVSVILILQNNHAVLDDHIREAGTTDGGANQAANWFSDNIGQAVESGANNVTGDGLAAYWVPIVTASTAGTAGTWFTSKLQKGPFTAMIYTAFALLTLAASFYGMVKVGMLIGNCNGGVDAFIGTHSATLKILPWVLVSAAIGMPVLYGTCMLLGGIGGSGQGDAQQVMYMPLKHSAPLEGPTATTVPTVLPGPTARRLICSESMSCVALFGLLSVFATLIFMVWKYSALLDAKSVPAKNDYVVKKPAIFPLSPRQGSPRIVINA
jgi:hypothetical protein